MRKTILKILMLLIILAVACQVQAYPDKDFSSSGQINDGEYWNNVNIYGDDTVVDMYYDAWVLSVTTYNKSEFNIYGGSIDGPLTGSDNSAVNISGGWFDFVIVEDFSILNIISGHGGLGDLSATGGSINLYAYDVLYDPTGGYYGEGLLTGKYLSNDHYFDYDLHEGTYSHITVVPEPISLLLIGLGGLFLRKRKS